MNTERMITNGVNLLEFWFNYDSARQHKGNL
jgi:hypothetical protein